MEQYEAFSDQDFAYLTEIWRECGIGSVQVITGPLNVFWDFDILNSTIHISTSEAGQVHPGSMRWYDSRYIMFRCLYGIMRLQGLMNWEWEVPSEYQDSDFFLYKEMIRVYQPHVRVKFPRLLGDPFIIENLWSNSYMNIFPIIPPIRPEATYPDGDTTVWVDSFLNEHASFCPDILTGLNVDGDLISG